MKEAEAGLLTEGDRLPAKFDSLMSEPVQVSSGASEQWWLLQRA